MQYAVSDIHGCYDKYVQLLRRIDLKKSDTLYILGDMIDRGPDGLKILRDISMRPNIISCATQMSSPRQIFFLVFERFLSKGKAAAPHKNLSPSKQFPPDFPDRHTPG